MRWLHKLLGRYDIYFNGSLYMRRWRLLHNRFFGLRVHNIVRSDADRELHDHPFSFVSIILAGGYWEHTVDGRKTWYGPGSVIFRSADVLHRLELDKSYPNEPMSVECPAWTIVLRGPETRVWGFLTDKGWVEADAFINERYNKPQA